MLVKNLTVLLLIVVFSYQEGAFGKAVDYEMKIAEKPGRVRLRDIPYFRVLLENKDHRYKVIRGRKPKTIVEDHDENEDKVDPATTQHRKRSVVFAPGKEFDQKEICEHYRFKGYVPVFCKSQRMGRKLDGVKPETDEVETVEKEAGNNFSPYFIIASPGYVPNLHVSHQSRTNPPTLLSPPAVTEAPGYFRNPEIEMPLTHKPVTSEVGEKPSAGEPEPFVDGQPSEILNNYYYQHKTPNFQLPSTWSLYQSHPSPEYIPHVLHQTTLVQPTQIQSQMPAYLYSNQNLNYVPYGNILPHPRKKPSIGTVVGGAFAAGAGLAIANHFLNRPKPQAYQHYHVPTNYPTHYSSPHPYPGYTYSSSYGRLYGGNDDPDPPESVPADANLEQNDGVATLNERIKRDHHDDRKVSKKKNKTKTKQKKKTGNKNKGPSKGTKIAGLVLGAAAGNFVANHFLNKPSGGGFLGGTSYHQGYGGYPQPAHQYSPGYTPAHNYHSYPQPFSQTSYPPQSSFTQTSYPYSQSFPQTSYPSYPSSYYPHVARQTEIRQPLVLFSTQTGSGFEPFSPSYQQPLKAGSYYIEPYFLYPSTGALTVAQG